MLVVAGPRAGQVGAGSARRPLSAALKSFCQGQRAGRCSVQRRAVRVRRPGIESSRRRRVRATRTVAPGRPRTVVQRSRLCARAAITVQAAFGAVVPGREVLKRLVFEVADDELDDGVLAMLSAGASLKAAVNTSRTK